MNSRRGIYNFGFILYFSIIMFENLHPSNKENRAGPSGAKVVRQRPKKRRTGKIYEQNNSYYCVKCIKSLTICIYYYIKKYLELLYLFTVTPRAAEKEVAAMAAEKEAASTAAEVMPIEEEAALAVLAIQEEEEVAEPPEALPVEEEPDGKIKVEIVLKNIYIIDTFILQRSWPRSRPLLWGRSIPHSHCHCH